MKPIEMLAEVLRSAQLSARERESFEDMYDRINRFKRCSDRQKAWIEKVYYGQQLDRQTPIARRRVVVPTWQKSDETVIRRIAPSPVDTPPPLIKAIGTSARAETSSRHVLVENRPKSGTFRASPVAPSPSSQQVGYINYPGISRETPVTNLTMFESVCPRIRPGSRQHQTVANFFASGGIVVKVKPLGTAQVA